jgi:hypothetical protein
MTDLIGAYVDPKNLHFKKPIKRMDSLSGTFKKLKTSLLENVNALK